MKRYVVEFKRGDNWYVLNEFYCSITALDFILQSIRIDRLHGVSFVYRIVKVCEIYD